MKEDIEYKLHNLKQKAQNTIDAVNLYKYKGVVSKLLGLTVEVKLPGLKVGDLCYIQTYTGEKKAAEVQAFKGEVAQLSLLLDGEGIGQGSLVTSTGKPIIIPVGSLAARRESSSSGEVIALTAIDLTSPSR